MFGNVHVAFEDPTDSHVLASDEDDATSVR